MVKLKNNYEIDSDGKNSFLLLYDSGRLDKDNKPVKLTYGYYSSFSSALIGYCNQILMDKVASNEMDLIDVKKALEELKQEIKVYEMEG